jgi:integrase
LIIIGVDTGLRRGETLSLKWSDVDLEVERGRIHIRPENEKTNRGRTVSLRDRLKAELVTLWEQSEKQPDGFVFGIRDNFKNSWRTVCRLAGVTNLRYHDLRHTAISRMVKAGVPVSTAMKIAGHTTLGMFNRYHNLTNEDVDMAAAALDKIMDEPPSDRLTDEINQKPDFKM